MFRAAAALQERERESPFAHSPELPVTLADLIPSSGPWHSTSLNFSLLQQQQLPPPLLFFFFFFSMQYKSPSLSLSLSLPVSSQSLFFTFLSLRFSASLPLLLLSSSAPVGRSRNASSALLPPPPLPSPPLLLGNVHGTQQAGMVLSGPPLFSGFLFPYARTTTHYYKYYYCTRYSRRDERTYTHAHQSLLFLFIIFEGREIEREREK